MNINKESILSKADHMITIIEEMKKEMHSENFGKQEAASISILCIYQYFLENLRKDCIATIIRQDFATACQKHFNENNPD